MSDLGELSDNDLGDVDEREPTLRDSFDDLRVSNLDTREIRSLDRRTLPWHVPRVWRATALVVTVVALGALIASALPGGGLAGALARFAHPTATPKVTSNSEISIAPIGPALPRTNLVAEPAPRLAAAPKTCWGGSETAPDVAHAGPPSYSLAVGHSPVWLSGFSKPGATLILGSFAQSVAWGGWDAPYTQAGWPAPIILVLGSNTHGTVSLFGWNETTYQPVQFGFLAAGEWGAPTSVSQDYRIDPLQPPIPAGGEDANGMFWYGYIFLPQAGCYELNASWPDGEWDVSVSAGQ